MSFLWVSALFFFFLNDLDILLLKLLNDGKESNSTRDKEISIP